MFARSAAAHPQGTAPEGLRLGAATVIGLLDVGEAIRSLRRLDQKKVAS